MRILGGTEQYCHAIGGDWASLLGAGRAVEIDFGWLGIDVKIDVWEFHIMTSSTRPCDILSEDLSGFLVLNSSTANSFSEIIIEFAVATGRSTVRPSLIHMDLSFLPLLSLWYISTRRRPAQFCHQTVP